MFDTTHDRAKAQAVKLEAAERIEEATQRLKDGQIQDPVLAREMAEAEMPHRNEIADRKKDVAMAKEAADLATKNYVDGIGNVGTEELERKQTHVTMLRGVTEKANRRSLR
jgi:hypothetical protein